MDGASRAYLCWILQEHVDHMRFITTSGTETTLFVIEWLRNLDVNGGNF
jgi:hypothetical protein